MGSTVKSRPNHYDVLGLTPAASSEEISQAFAEQLNPLRPRAFGSLAEVTIAFETLRDRAKRDAYDIAHGLKPKPTPPAPDVPPEWAPFLIRASARPAVRPAVTPAPPPKPQVKARPQPEPVAEPKISPFEAARAELIKLPTHEVHLDPMPAAEEPRRQEPAIPAFEPRTGTDQLHFAETGRFRIESDAPFQWKLPALAAGALVFAVGVGAWTGLEAGNDNGQMQSEQAATLKIPPAKPLPAMSALSDATVPSVAEAQPARRTRAAPTSQIASNRQPLQITLPDEQPVETMAEQPEVAAEQTVAEMPSVAPTQASLPLPNAVIARTIGRIGYPCGQVAGATALGSGAFKVTCTSGHSYRAAPVRGRYRFRRM